MIPTTTSTLFFFLQDPSPFLFLSPFPLPTTTGPPSRLKTFRQMTSLLLLALVASLSSVQAHLQIASPFPYHSSLNPLTPEASKDYSMTAPLVSNGLPFPCKGVSSSSLLLFELRPFILRVLLSVQGPFFFTQGRLTSDLPSYHFQYIGTTGEGPNQQWTAGQTVDVEIAGTAVHGGGCESRFILLIKPSHLLTCGKHTEKTKEGGEGWEVAEEGGRITTPLSLDVPFVPLPSPSPSRRPGSC